MATSPSGEYAWYRSCVDRAKFLFAISAIHGKLEPYQIGSRSGRHVGQNAPPANQRSAMAAVSLGDRRVRVRTLTRFLSI
jgi:hypothetical protein